MAQRDAISLAEQAVRLGLLLPAQVQDAWKALGKRGGEPEPMLRILERQGALTPWQSQKLFKGDADGYFFGGYRILYKISSGSFGRVYRADDPRTGRIVAVKVLRKKWSEKKHDIDLFEREGRLGMTLQHPNIVEILAVHRDQASKQSYIVMEFVEGGNLRDFLGIRKKLEPEETLHILDDVCSGLAYAYSHGVCHRDMKLTNILISSQGRAKLVDFGLAAVTEQSAMQDEPIERTVDYAGLEKATGVPAGDPRSDIFFLGCVAYELLTGRSPLEMSKNAQVRMAKERFTSATQLRIEEVAGRRDVLRLVDTMMSLNAAERYQSPAQVLEVVRELRQVPEVKPATTAGTKPGATRPGRNLFLAERDERLQDVLRTKLKERGFRVLIAADPTRALDRYKVQPYEFLIVNAETTGEEGFLIFERIMHEAERSGAHCSGILMLAREQAKWADKLHALPGVSVLVQPLTFKQLVHAIEGQEQTQDP